MYIVVVVVELLFDVHGKHLCSSRSVMSDDDDLRFYVLFNSISVISGRCLNDNERLCAMELRLRMRRFHLE